GANPLLLRIHSHRLRSCAYRPTHTRALAQILSPKGPIQANLSLFRPPFSDLNPTMSILVTGGAGYIGSHVVRQLRERNETVVVLDNLSTGFRSAILGAPLVVGDTGDRELVTDVLREHRIETVMHFAAHTIVPESVSNPLKYYGNNTCSTRNLLQCCQEAGVKHFVFSSTAAVYG